MLCSKNSTYVYGFLSLFHGHEILVITLKLLNKHTVAMKRSIIMLLHMYVCMLYVCMYVCMYVNQLIAFY